MKETKKQRSLLCHVYVESILCMNYFAVVMTEAFKITSPLGEKLARYP